MMADDKFSDLIEIFADIGQQIFRLGMFALDLLENFSRRLVGIDFFGGLGKRGLLLF